MVLYYKIFSFNRIDLPEYGTKEIVREKLLKSLKESGSGFDLSWYILIIIFYTKYLRFSSAYSSWRFTKKIFSIFSIKNKV